MPADMFDATNTRRRLLEVAGAVFAEKGFRSATIREICNRAGANVAAVNYHFGDKGRLYAEVLKYAHHCAVEKYPPALGVAESAEAAERLAAFIRSFLFRILDQGRPAWHGKLMMRELTEPTNALDDLVEESIRPNFNLLTGIVRQLLGRDAGEETVRMCAASIVGQCLHYCHARPVITRLSPHQTFDPSDIGRLAEHITQFSLGAIRRMAEGDENR